MRNNPPVYAFKDDESSPFGSQERQGLTPHPLSQKNPSGLGLYRIRAPTRKKEDVKESNRGKKDNI